MNRNRRIPLVCLVGFWFTLGWMTAAFPFQAQSYPPEVTVEEVYQTILQQPNTHPRLLADQNELEALKEKVERNPQARGLSEILIAQADSLLETQPVERVLQGRRLLGQSRRALQRILTLATAFHLTDDDRYVERCEKEMLAAAGFQDWNPSHFLDVAEMTFALAVGYDWLYHQLDEASRSTIRTAILEKGVILPFETEHNRWVRSSNNWGQVCHGGLTAGALAVMEFEPKLAAKTVHNALHNVVHSMKAFAPNGSYPEGPGYWSYGTTYNVLLIDVIQGVLGSDFGLSQAPGFEETGPYLSLVTGPSGYTFNYADGGAGRSLEPAVFWFARRYGRPDWSIGEFGLVNAMIQKAKQSSAPVFGSRFLPLALLWMEDKPEKVSLRMPLHWWGKGEVPVTVHRSSWTDPHHLFVGLKAGSPSFNHGNMDSGSFVLDADGERWALDLGAEGYHGIESRGMNLWSRSQDSDRWKIFRQQNHGHNTLVIDGQLQVAKNKSEIIRFSDDPAFPFSIVDMSFNYEGQASSVQRGVALLPSKEVLIQDEISGLKPGASVRWGMITKAKIEKIDDVWVNLEQNGKSMRLVHLSQKRSAESAMRWSVIDTATPRNEWDSPNPDTRMIAAIGNAGEDGRLSITILFTPGTCEASVMEEWEPLSLSHWGKE